MSSSYPIAWLVLFVALAGCADAQRPRPAYASAPELRSLKESDAIALIDELLREARWQPVPSWTVEVPPYAELEVDVRLGDTSFGIEWVSEEDRERYGGLLPAPDPDGQLRLLTGAGSDPQGRPLILVLDHETYRFANQHAQVEGIHDLHDAEELLRRDLTDFIEYARSQGRL
jgi:hypothetical protein